MLPHWFIMKKAENTKQTNKKLLKTFTHHLLIFFYKSNSFPLSSNGVRASSLNRCVFTTNLKLPLKKLKGYFKNYNSRDKFF